MTEQNPLGPVMIDVAGVSLTNDEKQLLRHPYVGGLILFTRNFESLDQLRDLIKEIREHRADIIIAVDHEGGRVQRFREGFSSIPAMANLGCVYEHDKVKALKYAREMGWLMAAEVRAFDIDISFAPVMDLDHGISEIIGNRAFSSSPDAVVDLTAAFIEGMHEAGMASTGKHFPGHGGVEADSHIAIPVDERSLDEITREDMAVFSSMVDKGMDAVMPAHVIYPAVDKAPAGFSSIWVQDILRGQLGFDNVVFSDDLSMEGATVAGSFSDRAAAALEAGCDMVLVCNNPEAAKEVISSLDDSLVPSECGSRLSKLKGRLTHNYDELKQSRRWLDAQKIINDLTT